MSGLQTIRKLVASMSPEEQTTLRQLLLSFDSRGEKFNSKSVRLLDLLIEPSESMSDRDMEFVIYGKRSTPAFSRLVIRFRDKLLESLLLDVNVKREGNYSDVYIHLFEVRKKISYAQILIGRGLNELALFLYESVMEICKMYEFYEELLIAIRLRMQIVSLTQGNEYMRKLKQDYRKYDRCREAALFAYFDYNTLVSNTEFKTRKEGLIPFLEQATARMAQDMEETGSANVAFYRYYLEAQLHQENHMYREARKSLQKLASLVQKSPALNVQYRLGNVFINLADNELYLRSFDRCVDYCHRAIGQLKVGSFNEFQCMETEFYGHYYAGRYEAAHRLLAELIDRDSGKHTAFRRGKRHYLQACTLFMQREFREAQDILMEVNVIDADREGWNVGIRMLAVLTDIERSLHDLAGKKIENIRKHLRKLEEEQKLRRRDELIYEVLRALDHRSYDFVHTWRDMQEHFELLRSNDPDCCWQIKSPELIIFHEWFFSKVSKVKFIQKIPKLIEQHSSAPTQEG